jgi:NAD dependent epimerase/dehydratase
MDLAGKHVVVTGADGFIGSHLTEALVAKGCAVRAFCFYNSFGSLGWLDTLPSATRDELDIFMGDIRDPNGVRTALHGTAAVFHLAALIGIPFSYHSPDSYVDTNVKGTLNVLQAARDLDVERVVITSTSEVYGTARSVPIDESHPLQGQSPYSATKIAADKLAEAFFRSFDVPVVTVRPFNTYGPRQSMRAVIPTIISQLLSRADEVRLGALHPTRDLTFVADSVRGFVALGACDAAVGREVNLGTGSEISIGELATLLCEIVGSTARVVEDAARLRPSGSEVERLVSDPSLVHRLTGWVAETSLREGLESTVQWLVANGDRFRPGYAI